MKALLGMLVAFIAICSEIEVAQLNKTDISTFCYNKTCYLNLFAPLCGHCQHLAPTWKVIAGNYSNGATLIAEIDCTQEQNLDVMQDFQARVFPTVIILERDQFYVYSGNRSEESLVEFLKNHSSAQPMKSPYITVPKQKCNCCICSIVGGVIVVLVIVLAVSKKMKPAGKVAKKPEAKLIEPLKEEQKPVNTENKQKVE